jgi:hypothetical protein
MLYRVELRNERGIALVVVLLVVLAIAAIAAGAAFLGSNTSLINKYHDRQSVLEAAADAGLEEARSVVNGDKSKYPASGYTTLENGAAVYSASGAVIPNVKRWTYVGPTGISSGQYGVFGSAVVVVQDAQGNRVIRRGEIYQESFAKFAYFTDVEGAIMFAAGDQLYGPVHSNDVINISSALPKATFNGPVTTAKTINTVAYGNFVSTYTQNTAVIPFPDVADLTALQTQAAAGNMSIASTTSGTVGQATTRIEFVALDLDNDNDSTDDNEGFIKVYKVTNAANAWWVVADTGGSYGTYGANGVQKSRNCGHINGINPGKHSDFKTFAHHAAGAAQDLAGWAVNNGTQRRCYLGGSDILNDWTAPTGEFLSGATAATGDSLGSWQAWPGPIDPLLSAKVGATYAQYLWPINRSMNTNFKGVIYVSGKVAVSGKLRGRVTLAATDNIIIADDITYVTNAGSTIVACDSRARDILGLFSGTDVIMADNILNDPIPAVAGQALVTWDETPDEFINAVVLALDNWTVENYTLGPSASNPANPNGLGPTGAGGQWCGATAWGRGCLFLTGGIIQKTRGAVGLASGTGYLKRYSYDNCAEKNPPPYFPTTGRFVRGHYYEVEPTGFNIATYWPLLVPNP